MRTLYRAVVRHEDSGCAALYFENKTISYKVLGQNIRRAVSYLQGCGIGAGDVVTMALPNIPQTVYLFYALDAIGAKINIIHPLSTVTAIFDAMRRTGATHAILSETLWGEHGAEFAESGYDIHFVNPAYEVSEIMRRAFYFKYKRARVTGKIHSADTLYKMPEQKEICDRDPEESSIYLHSGGTTGEPKVIELSDRALNRLAERVPSILEDEPRAASMLCVLPTFHGFGLGICMHAPLYCGKASALMMKFNSDKLIKWINEGKVNVIIGVPLLYQKLMANKDFERAKLQNLTHCFIGGDNVLPAQIEQYNTLFSEHGSDSKLLEGFGLTETVTVCTVNTKSKCKAGSVGCPLDGMVVGVRDEQQKPLGTDEVGELYVLSDTQMNGYLNDTEATEKTLVTIDGDRWVRTGDIGYVDRDGFVFLKGRKKRMFKISGINIFPSEVEKVASSHPCIYEAAMEFFCEPKPHTKLFVIKSKHADKENSEIEAELRELLASRFLKYELPTDIVFLQEFPRTKVGKCDHNALSKKENI